MTNNVTSEKIDELVKDVQHKVYRLITTEKIPQTQKGARIVLDVIRDSLENFATTGAHSVEISVRNPEGLQLLEIISVFTLDGSLNAYLRNCVECRRQRITRLLMSRGHGIASLPCKVCYLCDMHCLCKRGMAQRGTVDVNTL